MFQGTLLVKNEVEMFLKALRVPVEKLKKREIESLMERICFLSDLVQPTPPVARIKQTMAAEFSHKLGIQSDSRNVDSSGKPAPQRRDTLL